MIRPALLILLLLATAACRGGGGDATDAPRRVVVVVIDTLRADDLTLLPEYAAAAPFLTSLAEGALVFESAWSTSTWTAPATASIFTSLHPLQHGVTMGMHAYEAGGREEGNVRLNRISEEAETLPEMMRRAGYRTYGVSTNPNVVAEEGFARGFDGFRYLPEERSTADVRESLEEWRDDFLAAEHAFLYLHLMDPHTPYHARDPWFELSDETRAALDPFLASPQGQKYTKRADGALVLNPIELVRQVQDGTDPTLPLEQVIEILRAAYRSEIRFLDEELGALFARLELGEETLVVVTADHGEEFLDHGHLLHQFTLYDELLRVPLFVRLPGPDSVAGRIAHPASVLDVLPTLRRAVGLAPRASDEGIDLLELTGNTAPPARGLLAHRRSMLDEESWKSAILADGFKLVRTFPGGEEELYELVRDPGERRNLAPRRPRVVERLRELLTRTEGELPPFAPSFWEGGPMSEEQRRLLEKLGYTGEQD